MREREGERRRSARERETERGEDDATNNNHLRTRDVYVSDCPSISPLSGACAVVASVCMLWLSP
jgi:hypothetical protein